MTNLPAPKSSSVPERSTTLLRSLTIRNYKSVVDATLDLSGFNMFIGENGCGKSNILEALGMAAAGLTHRLTDEDLYNRGIRLARPSIVASAFPNALGVSGVGYTLMADDLDEKFAFSIISEDGSWKCLSHFTETQSKGIEEEARNNIKSESLQEKMREAIQEAFSIRLDHKDDAVKFYIKTLQTNILSLANGGSYDQNLASYRLSNFVIYSLNTLALRGLQVESRRDPLGLYGEGLDILIAQMSEEERARLNEYAQLVSWVDGLEIDTEGARKLQGYKPGRSRSELYFHDRFMAEENRTFSAENANEGILHVLFYLALFMSKKTPRLFAIDNIETALNPRLLRHLIKQLAGLAKEHGKQALVTTHNPAALDGLNLLDDDQRLFEVYRNDEGHTQVRRIKVKPEHAGEKLKLSEMWMRGMLGAIPTHF